MKRLSVIVLLLAFSFYWIACKKKSNPGPDPVIPMGMFANVNGAAWVGSGVSIFSTTGFGPEFLEFSSYDTSGKGIEFRIVNFKNRGTYNIPQANDSAFYGTDYGSFSSPVVATSGQISIQAVTDSTVGGVFHFSGPGITVTDGTFNVKYN